MKKYILTLFMILGLVSAGWCYGKGTNFDGSDRTQLLNNIFNSQADFALLTATGINSSPIGATTPSTGAFTTLSSSGAATLASAGVTGNFAVNTNKFNVTAASGDTAVAGTLGVTGASTLAAVGATTIAASDNITIGTANKGLVLKRGAHGKCGTFTLNGATTVDVANTSIAITDTIIISLNTVGGTVGALPSIKTITAGTGFGISGTAGDTSIYNYTIISNAA